MDSPFKSKCMYMFQWHTSSCSLGPGCKFSFRLCSQGSCPHLNQNKMHHICDMYLITPEPHKKQATKSSLFLKRRNVAIFSLTCHKHAIVIQLANTIHINSTKQTVCSDNMQGLFFLRLSLPHHHGVKMKDSQCKSSTHGI